MSSILERVAIRIALGRIKAKVDRARKAGSEMMKALDGQKRLIVVLGFIVSALVSLTTGQDVGQWLDMGLRAMGWTSAEDIAAAKAFALQIAPLILSLWAAACGIIKLIKQRKAGATFKEMGSVEGYAKLAIAEGVVEGRVMSDGRARAVVVKKG